MRTRDFSAAPPLARAQVMLTVEPRDGSSTPRWRRRAVAAVEGDGLVRREWLRAGVRRVGVIAWYADQAAAQAAIRRVQGGPGGLVQVHDADPDGYSNGVWRAEDGVMAHIERFSPVGAEEAGPTVARQPRSTTDAARSTADQGRAATTPTATTTAAPDFLVVPVRNREDLRDFLRVPPWGTPRETHGVPLWHSTIRSWWRGKGPHRRHGAVELYLVRDGWGGVAGRTTLHTDERMDAKLGERVLLMGATEFAGAPALAALVEHAEAVARERGRTRLLGPVSLLPNQVGGVLTSCWEEPGFLDGPWTPSHYHRHWEALGFERIWEGSTWVCPDLGSLDPTTIFPVGALPEGVVLRHADRRRLDEQLPVLRQMLNAAFAELGYFTQIEADELAAATDGLAHLLDERLLLWLERDGEPVAFVLVVPDLTAFVRSTRGRLGPVDLARLLVTKGRYRRDAVLIIKGTVPGARGQGLMRHLSRELLEGLQAGGYAALRVTFVEHDNAGSQSQFVAMGGRPLHGTCFYTRAVDVRDETGSARADASGIGEAESSGATTDATPAEAPDVSPVDARGTSGAATDAASPASRLLARAADWGRAPSAHNTQPWDVRALDDVTLRLGWHADRALPVADPTHRDLMLSLGAVALSLQVVAAELGLVAKVEWGVAVGVRQAAVIRLSDGQGPRLAWSVAELHARSTVRAAYEQQPTPEEVAALADLAQLPAGTGLLVLPDALVDDLLPGATARTLTGPPASELREWLRLTPAHPRRDLDGLSAQALGLSAAQARGLGLLTGSGLARRALGATRLDRLVARVSEVRPRGAVVALWGPPGLGLDELGPLGGGLLGVWLAAERAGWSAHPLSELLDSPTSASALQTHVGAVLGHPAQVYAVWRCGRAAAATGTGAGAAYRSPRLTD